MVGGRGKHELTSVFKGGTEPERLRTPALKIIEFLVDYRVLGHFLLGRVVMGVKEFLVHTNNFTLF